MKKAEQGLPFPFYRQGNLNPRWWNKFPEMTRPAATAVQSRMWVCWAPTPVHFERRRATVRKGRAPDEVGGGIAFQLHRRYYSPVASCHGDLLSRQKFSLLTGSEWSKRKKKKAFRCQDSRERFVDFLLHIDNFQVGFEANFLI